MNLHLFDWCLVGGFVVLMVFIAIVSTRMTKSVAGFLSAERCAGRYLLTVSGGMAFLATVGMVGGWEAGYRNGLAPLWWGLLGGAISLVVALSGWVTYRYRETRSLTMGQFLEKRYSRRFRIFAGFAAFFSGVLNCAIFPMVTAHCLVYFIGIPPSFELFGVAVSSFHSIMFIMVASAVILAVAGGQIAVMVSDFVVGTFANLACVAIIAFVVFSIGTGNLLDALFSSETADPAASPEQLEGLTRVAGTSLLNPFLIGDLPDFGFLFFLIIILNNFFQVGVWQGGAGYLTAARTPHEGKMGNILGQWRWVVFGLMSALMPVIVYTVMHNPQFAHLHPEILAASEQISDPLQQSRMFVPVALSHILPVGLLGLFCILLIGASISTDNSYYHSWGSTLVQDVIMPLRKKPLELAEHIAYLRWSIVGVGAFAFLFSCIWELRDFIPMWFTITGSIYVGGAFCAIIGGLYWSRGSTAGAWAGMLTGSVLAVSGIVVKQIWPEISVGSTVLNGQHIGMISIFIAILVFVVTSHLTCRVPCPMDKLLYRGKYAVKGEHAIHQPSGYHWLHWFGITKEFTHGDKLIVLLVYFWICGWALVFMIGSVWNLAYEVPSTSWRWWWGTVHLPVLFVFSGALTLWLTEGSIRDVLRLVKDLRNRSVDQEDDGTVTVHLGAGSNDEEDGQK